MLRTVHPGVPGGRGIRHSRCVSLPPIPDLDSRWEMLGPWPEDGLVLLACSGGADSTFLAQEFLLFAQGRMPGLAVVVDHGHRPDSGDLALQAAEGIRGLGLEVVIRRGSATAGDEASLRDLRYQILAEEARSRNSPAVVLGHTAEDQAETVLLRLFRGTGLRGLAGIPARRPLLLQGQLVSEIRRPLLACRRQQVRQSLRDSGVSWLEDPSNADPGFAARNRLRLEAWPLLQNLATGDPVSAILRMAEEAAEWNGAVAELLDAEGDWHAQPSLLRRLAIAEHLRNMKETVSPARLRDLESALLSRKQAGVTAAKELRLREGRLVALSLPSSQSARKGAEPGPECH